MADSNDGDVIRGIAKCYGPDEQVVANVFHWQLELTTTPVPDDTVMTAIQSRLDTMYTLLEDYISEDVVSDNIDFYNVTQDRPMGTKNWPGFGGGLATAEHLPAGVAALIEASTGTKRCYGRKYVGVFTEADHGDGEWTSGLLTALAVWAGNWVSNVTVSTYGVAWSGVWRRVQETFVKILSSTVKSLCSYQRRRKPGRGV